MRAVLPAILVAVLFALPAGAQDPCPCVPLTHLWVVKTCSNWNCASTELLLAAGDPQVMAIPVGIDDARWLVVRRFMAGAALDQTDDPFQLEQFEGIADAVTRYAIVPRDHQPMLLTAPDGRVLVISLRQPETRRRAAAH